MKIGVLGLQGAVREHIKHIEQTGHEGIVIKTVNQLNEIDGLVLPGGESTTMRRLMDLYGFTEALRNSEIPMYGTCAGLILLAKAVVGQESHLNKLNVVVERNSFGRQVDSFEQDLDVKGIDEAVNAVFIRAPHIQSAHEGVEVLSTVEDRIVAVRQNQYLGISFHPELTDDYKIMKYFIEEIVEQYQVKQPQ
ncbi:MAG TPA: pyridoxal 5'-phosphate synthase glutaminase subunit PdxT [Staphylococcus sp.]|uniref:pyridoxal 5'-phosphate synthase glutaminase subunit PdxT n=1 Tax=Mammaliicoccus vitulinus TaxID=71237 RepID=UPI00030ECFD9|nr:pyridoxal 5'-phosphate synthase glutaminase subunit PdxT [Mammaliicoccus vitulinus]HAL08364.1 pyridoxal 5'-phosphate synthase glutaminase subunit PdxT [Staphylococcus sp.]MBM6629709.1 pyridoxal 5'-phosphate synthase glutaminase subunit PdxT [Mammaliicoccus vitulinus]MBO3075952.1 pyridoxal 5'-phosphate synthase glutaminase subunit PdxT [Mammaliicoccus vitulinus]MEB7658593.1 pyridoxal 5'-phosphate synthase glutaminase subunit PdxT [Mammaliicoccus vitulinus]QJF24115.1 pyridoxal 5'-phosphate sy